MNNASVNGNVAVDPIIPETDEFTVDLAYHPWLDEFLETAMQASQFVDDPEVDQHALVDLDVQSLTAFLPGTPNVIGPVTLPPPVIPDDRSYEPWHVPDDDAGEPDIGRNIPLPEGSGSQIWNKLVTIDFSPEDDTIPPTPVGHLVVGTIRASGEENGPKTARFTLRPYGDLVDVNLSTADNPLRDLDLCAYYGKPIQIAHVLLDPQGAITASKLIFTGFIEEPEFDISSKLLTLACSDFRIKKIQGLTKQQADALLVPAGETVTNTKWHSAVFDEEAEIDEYVDDRLSTVPYALDLDSQNRWRYTAWETKSEADFIFADHQFIYRTAGVELARGNDVVNQIDVDLSYGFPRLKKKTVTFSWSFPGSLCDYLGASWRTHHPLRRGSYTVPTKDMIIQAAQGTGWCLEAISFLEWWKSRWADECRAYLVSQPDYVGTGNPYSGLIGFINHTTELTRRASGRLRKTTQQPVNEKYKIAFRVKGSQKVYGLLKQTLNFSMSANADVDDFINEDCCQPKINQWEVHAGSTSGNDYITDADSLQFVTDGTDRAGFNAAMRIIECQAKTILLDAHRQNRVVFQVPLNPMIERHHTVRIEGAEITAQGKVFGILHSMDTETGKAFTEIEIAVSKSGDDTLDTLPTYTDFAIPDKPPAPVDSVSNKRSHINLPTRYGGITRYNSWDDQVARGDIGVPAPPLGRYTYGGVGGRGNGTSAFDRVSQTDPESTGPCEDNFDDVWDGYIGNKEPADEPTMHTQGDPDAYNDETITYSERFVIKMDEFDERDTEDIEIDSPELVYDVRVPDDLLIVRV